MVSRLWDSAKKRVTDCAICGPMPWISLMSGSRRGQQLVHAAEARGEELGRALANHADAEAVQQTREPARLRRRRSPPPGCRADLSASRSSPASASAVSL